MNYDHSKYIVAEYNLKSSINLHDAAHCIAIGQSIGNPSIRNEWETKELVNNHQCIIIDRGYKNQKQGYVKIGFPIANLNIEEDGISQLLCFLMGGHLDIDTIKRCELASLTIPSKMMYHAASPKFGIKGIREFTGIKDKPILGGIIKPKTGMPPETLLEMVKQLVEGGVNFIKEDEIMSNPNCCPLKERAKILQPYLKDKPVIYSYCVTADYPYIIDRVKWLADIGANSVHANIWCGLGIYKAIRSLDLPIFIHFQKSGDKIMTNINHNFSIRWPVICKLAAYMGVDFIHAGMWGGYSSDDSRQLNYIVYLLNKNQVMPALSCGMHPGIVNTITRKFGINYMANVGGAIHGHPGGTLAGTKAMRQAIDQNFGPEYDQAIKKWGLVE